MQTISRSLFPTVKTEGALLPAELLQRIADGRDLPGLRPEDYHLSGERLNEAISRAWSRCLGAWRNFREQSQKLASSDTGVTLTRERWLLVLFQALDYGRLPALRGGLEIDGAIYPISHLWQQTPFDLVSFRQDLDKRSDVVNTSKRSPHSLMQELLNRSDGHQWGIIANWLQLRILRDNASLSRTAYVEFDLEMMMDGELYADFALLWLVCHQSRFELRRAEYAADTEETEMPQPAETAAPSSYWLEIWSKTAAEQGTRALDALRSGVQEAIEALGRGFLAHPANRPLRESLQSGELSAQLYYHQLRRLVYRLIFLFVAEDRDLLLLPAADAATKQRYTTYYSLARLRRMAAATRGGPHADLYRQLRLVFSLLREGYPLLGLPGLDSFLFSARATPDLDGLDIANHELLNTIRALAFTVEGKVRRPVDYRNLGAEELGSVYESLLELHPEINGNAHTFALKSSAGSERKTSGSYYTPTSLINCLLDSALEPVIADRLAHCHSDIACHSEHSEESRVPSTSRRMAARDSSASPQNDKLSPQNDKLTSAEQALLSIKVVDPACGSGHFLIAAAHRLARHLARLRNGDEEPTPDQERVALRQVVRHCIYGVDVNEMAVELCKVALWMETLEPGKPLSFLEKNIQCGNSLIGVTPGLDISEIPDDAFQPVTGDDKATATLLRRRNKREREGKLGLRYNVTVIETIEDLARWRAEQLAQLERLADDDVAQVHLKEAVYASYLASAEYHKGRLAYDLWTASFFWPIPAGNADTLLAPTQQALIELRAGQTPDAELVRRVRELADEHQFFHWQVAFPEVFEREQAGFDVVLGNPPWERIKLQEKEWFAVRHPAIATAPNADARQRLIAQLTQEDPALLKAFLHDRRSAECGSHFVRNSDRYPLCGRGDVNTYTIFAELTRTVLNATGRIGVIVPSGIATDDTTKFFFQDVMDNGSLASLYSFENEEFIFPAIHHATKFCLLTLTGAAHPVITADFLFFARQISFLKDDDRHFSLSAEEILLLNPNTRTCPIFRSKRDAELTKAIYRRVPMLIKEDEQEGNPWGIKFFTMFHMSSNSDLFHTREQLECDGWRLVGNRFVTDGEIYLPLYEGKMMHHFDHRFGTYDEQTEAQANQGKLPELNEKQHQDPYLYSLPRYWVPFQEVKNRLGNYNRGWVIAFRDVTNAVVLRTSIFSILPISGIGNNAPIALIKVEHSKEALIFTSAVSSFVFDFVTRFGVGGMHLNFFILKQLPVLPPYIYTQLCPWADAACHSECSEESRLADHARPFAALRVTERETLHDWLLPRVLELTYTAWDLQPFAQDCGYAGPPFRWDEERRFLLRCELDAAYFHLYGISRADVAYILETFPIVKRKDVAKHGEYRTQRVILEIYDALAQAMQTGVAYQTPLDPPPADPRVAHGGRRVVDGQSIAQLEIDEEQHVMSGIHVA